MSSTWREPLQSGWTMSGRPWMCTGSWALLLGRCADLIVRIRPLHVLWAGDVAAGDLQVLRDAKTSEKVRCGPCQASHRQTRVSSGTAHCWLFAAAGKAQDT